MRLNETTWNAGQRPSISLCHPVSLPKARGQGSLGLAGLVCLIPRFFSHQNGFRRPASAATTATSPLTAQRHHLGGAGAQRGAPHSWTPSWTWIGCRSSHAPGLAGQEPREDGQRDTKLREFLSETEEIMNVDLTSPWPFRSS